LLRHLVTLTELLQPIFLFLLEIWLLLNLGLVEPVDDWVLALCYEYFLDLLRRQ
jgi:hypothetical protein